ncbi:MAG: tetratricopeptide repeat protein [Nitrosopumilaceae archaeon]
MGIPAYGVGNQSNNTDQELLARLDNLQSTVSSNQNEITQLNDLQSKIKQNQDEIKSQIDDIKSNIKQNQDEVEAILAVHDQKSAIETIYWAYLGIAFTLILSIFASVQAIVDQRRLRKFIDRTRHFEEANLYYQDGKFVEAKISYDKVLKDTPNDVGILTRISASLYNLGKYKEAIEYVEKILKIDPNNGEALANKALILTFLKKYPEALSVYEQVQNIVPDKASVLVNLGMLYVDHLEDYEKGLNCFNDALKINPYDPDASANKSKTLVLLKRFDEAIESADNALQLDPNDTLALTEKGNALHMLKRFEDALICYQRILKISPLGDKIIFNVANSLFELGRYLEAIPYLKEYLTIKSDKQYAIELLVKCYSKMGDKQNEELWHSKLPDKLNRSSKQHENG